MARTLASLLVLGAAAQSRLAVDLGMSFICVLAHGWSARYSFCCHPKLSLPFLPAGVGRARGGGGCAGCLWARERYAMSALRVFHNIEG